MKRFTRKYLRAAYSASQREKVEEDSSRRISEKNVSRKRRRRKKKGKRGENKRSCDSRRVGRQIRKGLADRKKKKRRRARERCVTRSFMAAQPFSLSLFCLHLRLFSTDSSSKSVFFFYCTPRSLFFAPPLSSLFYFILLDSRPLRPIETPLTHRPAASACWNAISRGLTSFPLDAKKSRRARHPIPACIMFSPIHIHLL